MSGGTSGDTLGVSRGHTWGVNRTHLRMSRGHTWGCQEDKPGNVKRAHLGLSRGHTWGCQEDTPGDVKRTHLGVSKGISAVSRRHTWRCRQAVHLTRWGTTNNLLSFTVSRRHTWCQGGTADDVRRIHLRISRKEETGADSVSQYIVS